jgi:hypothetical protein
MMATASRSPQRQETRHVASNLYFDLLMRFHYTCIEGNRTGTAHGPAVK